MLCIPFSIWSMGSDSVYPLLFSGTSNVFSPSTSLDLHSEYQTPVYQVQNIQKRLAFREGPKICKDNSNYVTFLEYLNFKVIDPSLRYFFRCLHGTYSSVFSRHKKWRKSKKISWEKNWEERLGIPTIHYIYILQFHTILAP